MARPQLGALPGTPTDIDFGDSADAGSSGSNAALDDHTHGMATIADGDVPGTHAGSAHHTRSHDHSAAGDGPDLAPASIAAYELRGDVTVDTELAHDLGDATAHLGDIYNRDLFMHSESVNGSPEIIMTWEDGATTAPSTFELSGRWKASAYEGAGGQVDLASIAFYTGDEVANLSGSGEMRFGVNLGGGTTITDVWGFNHDGHWRPLSGDAYDVGLAASRIRNLFVATTIDLDGTLQGTGVPSGELGGTWDSITVDSTHAGSAHHTKYTDGEAIAAIEGEATVVLAGLLTVQPSGGARLEIDATDFELNDDGVPDTDGVRLFSNAGHLYLQMGDGQQIFMRMEDNNIVWTLDTSGDVTMTGDLTISGTVDGVDIAARDHAKYLDSEVDAIVLTHKNLASAHHSKYTDAAVDAIVLTHKNLAAAHHAKYLDSAAVAAVNAEDPISPVSLSFGVGGGSGAEDGISWDLDTGFWSTGEGVVILQVNDQTVWTANTTELVLAKDISMVARAVYAKPPVVNVYTGNATWTRPTNPEVAYILIEVIGGGGGGGGTEATGSGEHAAAAGGGGGGYARKTVAGSVMSSNGTVVRGAGGAGASAGDNTGATGVTSSFNATGITAVQAAGGVGGTGSVGASSNTSNAGGAGGVGVAGDVNAQGSSGQDAGVSSGGRWNTGQGGASAFGGGPTSNLSGSGAVGYPYGGGGSGASENQNSSAQAGGNGGNGVVIITEYYA